MKNKKTIVVIIAVVAVIGIVAAAMAGSGKSNNPMDMSGTNDSSTADSSAASADKITIKEYMFGPMATTVKVGTKVTWTNEDAVVHTVTADTKMEGAPDSMDIAQHGSYSFTFTKAGTYKYHCQPHTYMQGTVIVTE